MKYNLSLHFQYESLTTSQTTDFGRRKRGCALNVEIEVNSVRKSNKWLENKK